MLSLYHLTSGDFGHQLVATLTEKEWSDDIAPAGGWIDRAVVLPIGTTVGLRVVRADGSALVDGGEVAIIVRGERPEADPSQDVPNVVSYTWAEADSDFDSGARGSELGRVQWVVAFPTGVRRFPTEPAQIELHRGLEPSPAAERSDVSRTP